MAVDLPKDALMEILARLPVESLVRFVCVCKSWYALIKSHDFITTHYNYSSSNDNASRIVVMRRCLDVDRYITSVLSNDGVEIYHDISSSFRLAESLFTLSSYCNGVIGVCNYYGAFAKRVALWNPATREVENLVLDDGIAIDTGYIEWSTLIGFGLNPKSNVYKVVRVRKFITPFGQYRAGKMEKYYVVDIHDVGNNNSSNESWRRLDADLPMTGCHNASVYADGFCYWAIDTRFEFRFVLSFDFINEVFERIPLPPGAMHNCIPSMATFGDSVAFVGQSLLDHDCCIAWVLNREGDRKTWIKQFSLPMQYELSPLFLTSGKVLMRLSDQLDLYDPSTQQPKKLMNIEYYSQMMNYVESLLSFKKYFPPCSELQFSACQSSDNDKGWHSL